MSCNEVFDRFEIEFDAGPDPIFHGGELITGFLKINLKQQITINSIRLQFKGHAKYTGDNQKKTDVEKIYFDKDIVLLERPPGWPEPGHFPWNANFTYSLPFECPLPKGCPTSYESPFGFIRYYARCTFETNKPTEPTYYMYKKAFNIILPPDHKHFVSVKPDSPITRTDISKFGSCCCRGKITTELTLLKSSFAPGENVTGLLSYDNKHSKYAIEQIEVRLIDRVKHINDKLLHESSSLVDGISNGILTKKPMHETINSEKYSLTANEIKSQKETLINKPKKRVVKKYYKSNVPITNLQKNNLIKTNDHRVLFARKLEKQDVIKSKTLLSKLELNLLTIPPVPSSIFSQNPDDVDFENSISKEILSLKSDVNDEKRISKLFELPSTATLRYRKQPFLQIEYAIQVSLGTQLLIEIPIQISPIPIYANGILFQPFAAGLQKIDEPDEKNKILINGPFLFQPFYPTYMPTAKPIQTKNLEKKVLTAQAVTNNNNNQIQVFVTESEENKDKIYNMNRSINKTTDLPNNSEIISQNKLSIITSDNNQFNNDSLETNKNNNMDLSLNENKSHFQTLFDVAQNQDTKDCLSLNLGENQKNSETFNAHKNSDIKYNEKNDNVNLQIKNELKLEKDDSKKLNETEKIVQEPYATCEQTLQNGHTSHNCKPKNFTQQNDFNVEYKENINSILLTDTTKENLEYDNEGQKNCINETKLPINNCTSDVINDNVVQ